jgi:hypothetical protein
VLERKQTVFEKGESRCDGHLRSSAGEELARGERESPTTPIGRNRVLVRAEHLPAGDPAESGVPQHLTVALAAHDGELELAGGSDTQRQTQGIDSFSGAQRAPSLPVSETWRRRRPASVDVGTLGISYISNCVEFRWNDWNLEHVAEHGVDPDEAEGQVVFVIDEDDLVYVIHARPLTEKERRRHRRWLRRP